jgi:hypothetical protein
MVVLLWVYYASLILLLGAEFTQVYARQTGARIAPEKYAVSAEKLSAEATPVESSVPATAPRRPSARLAAGGEVEPITDGRSLAGVFHRGAIPPGAPLGANAWKLLGLILAVGFAAGLFKTRRLRKDYRSIVVPKMAKWSQAQELDVVA